VECLENKSARIQLYLGEKKIAFLCLHLLNQVPLQGCESPTGFLAKQAEKNTWTGRFARGGPDGTLGHQRGEEGKAEKEGRATDQYFKHNRLTRATGWRGTRKLGVLLR